MNLRVENVNDDNEAYQLSPTETIISLNGREYKGDVSNGGLSLYDMLNNKKIIVMERLSSKELIVLMKMVSIWFVSYIQMQPEIKNKHLLLVSN